MTVDQVVEEGWSFIRFRIITWGETLQMWHDLQHMCEGVVLNDEEDRLVWILSANGKFSVLSFYCALKMQNYCYPYNFLRKVKLPLKIRVFLWLVLRNSILTKDNPLRRGWHGSKLCQFCGREETVEHLFLSCPLAKYTWTVLACTFNFQWMPVTIQSLLGGWLSQFPKSKCRLVIVGIAAVIWSIWKARNPAVFQFTFPSDPNSLIFNVCY